MFMPSWTRQFQFDKARIVLGEKDTGGLQVLLLAVGIYVNAA